MCEFESSSSPSSSSSSSSPSSSSFILLSALAWCPLRLSILHASSAREVRCVLPLAISPFVNHQSINLLSFVLVPRFSWKCFATMPWIDVHVPHSTVHWFVELCRPRDGIEHSDGAPLSLSLSLSPSSSSSCRRHHRICCGLSSSLFNVFFFLVGKVTFHKEYT